MNNGHGKLTVCEAYLEGNRCVNSKPHIICLRDHETVHLLKAFGVDINPMDGKCPVDHDHKFIVDVDCKNVIPMCRKAVRTNIGWMCPVKSCPHLADRSQRCVVTK